jgi:hypothetical protein
MNWKTGTVPFFLGTLLVSCAPADLGPEINNIACTMEAKACPDGSYVGRDAAKNCEFKPCPGK